MQRTRRMSLIVCIAATFAMTTAALQAAITVNLSFQEGVGGYAGTQDTHISNVSGQQNTDNSEQVNTRIQGPAGGGGPVNKQFPLLRFDNIIGPGPNQIPVGATIDSATVTLNSGDAIPGEIAMHRMLLTWPETGTWNSLFGGDGILLDNVEAAALADSALSVSVAGADFVWDVASSVQAWANGEANYGWVFINSVALSGNYIPFRTSEFGTVGLRPELIVQYTIPEPASLGLLLAGGLVVVGRRRRR